MSIKFWFGWPYTRWANRFACCKAPNDKKKQEEIMELFYIGELPLPSEKELITLSEERWLSIDNKCGRDFCKNIALDINGGYYPFENNPKGCCPGCGQPIKNYPVPILKDSGWKNFININCVHSYSRTIEFDQSISEEKQLLCVSWIYENDNPGYYAWKAIRNKNIWQLYTELDSSD